MRDLPDAGPEQVVPHTHLPLSRRRGPWSAGRRHRRAGRRTSPRARRPEPGRRPRRCGGPQLAREEPDSRLTAFLQLASSLPFLINTTVLHWTLLAVFPQIQSSKSKATSATGGKPRAGPGQQTRMTH